MRRLVKTVRMFAFVTQSNHLLSVFEQILKYQDIYCLSPSPILSCHFLAKDMNSSSIVITHSVIYESSAISFL